MRILRKIGFWLLMAASVPFAAWFWLVFVDIVSVPFALHYWRVESFAMTERTDANPVVTIDMTAKLSYTGLVTCRMHATSASSDGDLHAIAIVLDIEAPESTPEYVLGQIQRGCVNFTQDRLMLIAEGEDDDHKE